MKGYPCLIKKKRNQNFKFYILEAKQMYTTKCQVRARRSHKDFPNNLTKCGCHICHPGLRTQEAPHQCQVRLVAQWGQGHQQGPRRETTTPSHTQCQNITLHIMVTQQGIGRRKIKHSTVSRSQRSTVHTKGQESWCGTL